VANKELQVLPDDGEKVGIGSRDNVEGCPGKLAQGSGSGSGYV
jgi:hypothetical protein